MPRETDAELVEMVRERGDMDAYGQLIKRYQGHAQGLAYSILGDWTEAQDMAQEAFIRAYVNLHTLRDPGKFPAWLGRIVFSTCMRWLQTFRPQLYRSMGEPEDIDKLSEIPDSQTPTPADFALKSEMSEVVLSAISDLPQKYRIPITMFHLNGLSYQKVADFLEVPINTVRTLIRRAREMLRPSLESYAQEVLPMVSEVLNEHKLTDVFAQETVKILKGVPAEKEVRGIWHFDGTPASLRAVLKFKGVEEKYLDDTTFASILGQPFRFWFSDDFASCLAYSHEEPLGVIAAETLGFDYVWHPGGYGNASAFDIMQGKATLDKQAIETAWGKVRDLLSDGNPVLVFGGSSVADPKDGPTVLVGYDDNEELVYFVPHVTWEPAPNWDDADAECITGLKESGYRARKRPDETNWIGSGFAPGQGMGGAAICFFAFRDRVRVPSEHEVAIAVLQRAMAIGRGEVFDEFRPERKGGLKALDLLATTLAQGGRFSRRDFDWWYAMEGLGGPGPRKTAAAFVSRCATDFGDFTEVQKGHLGSGAQAYVESAARFDALWKLFASIGPLDEYDDRVKTVSAALSSHEFRMEAIDVIHRIREAEEAAITDIEKALDAEPSRGK